MENGRAKAIFEGPSRCLVALMGAFVFLKGGEIGEIMGVGYTSVSQERRRLRLRLVGDRKLAALIKRIEQKCHE